MLEHISTAERCIAVFKSSSSADDKVSALNEFALLLERAEAAYLLLNIPDWQNRREEFEIGALLELIINDDRLLNFLAATAEMFVTSFFLCLPSHMLETELWVSLRMSWQECASCWHVHLGQIGL